MLTIKFRRIGKKHQPSYRIVAAEKRSKMSGRFIEDLGWYDPFSKKFQINKERANYRLQTGAQPTNTAHNLLVKAGVISGPKRKIKIAKSQAATEPGGAEKTASPAESK